MNLQDVSALAESINMTQITDISQRLAAGNERPPSPLAAPARKPEWTPHIWQGIDFFGWVRLLAHNRFAVDWALLYVAAVASVVSLFHTALRYLQESWYGGAIARTPIRQAPIFIVGHWRTGTTLLHELLIQD
jgi:hypothetical protein